jgi:hypothetical protein
MAVFLLVAEHGAGYNPPPCTGLFSDVNCPNGFAVKFVERLYNEGITGGCGPGIFCPNSSTTQWQMTVFLTNGNLWPTYRGLPGGTTYTAMGLRGQS